MSVSVEIRAGGPEDLQAIAAIQSSSPEAAQWQPADYLAYGVLVAVCENRVAGFAVCRTVGPGESELLNLAVAPEYRRRGIGRALVQASIARFPGTIFLEVRASNRGALELYKSLCFVEFGTRPEYYLDPSESAIVLKFHSC